MRTDLGEPARTVLNNPRNAAERLDVVDARGQALIASLGRERRAGLGVAPLALAGVYQGCLFAADIRPGTHLDANVEIKPFLAAYILAQQTRLSHGGQDAVEVHQEIRVLAAKIKNALAGADGVTTNRHALEEQLSPLGENHAILERARLAFVGVADDDLVIAVGSAGEIPLHARRETRPASAAKTRRLDLADYLLRSHRQRLVQGRSGRDRRENDGARLALVVMHGRANQVAGVVAITQLVYQARRDQFIVGLEDLDDALGAVRAEIRHDLAVDKRCRALIAHTHAGSPFQADPTVGRCFAHGYAKRLLEALGNAVGPAHHTGHTVAYPDDKLAFLLLGQEGVERHDALDLHATSTHLRGDEIKRLAGDLPELVLNAPDDVHHAPAIIAASLTDVPDCLFEILAHYDSSMLKCLSTNLSVLSKE